MKKIITIFFVLSITLLGYAQWTAQTSGTANALRCVKFVDLNTGWAVGNNGTIIKTINGGNSWNVQTSNTTTDLYSLSFPTSTTGYVGGDLFRLLKTTNGGSTWNGYGYNFTNKLKSISFSSVNTGVGVGENIIFETTNGLSNISYWGSFGTQNCLYYISSNTRYSVGEGGSIIKLTGVISDFTSQTSGTTQNLNGVYFVSSSTGYVVGNNGTILKTVNGGTVWSTQNSNVVTNLNSVWFTDTNTGYVVGDNETILKTTDGGTTWIVQLTGGSNRLLSIYFKDANNGWIVGDNGEILHTTNGGTAIVGIASTPIGSISRCVGSNVYTTNAVNALSYVWTISPTNSGTIVSSGNSATITWSSNYSGNTTITSQGVNGSNLGAVSNSLEIYGVSSAFSLLAPANGLWNSTTPLFQWAKATDAFAYNLFIDGILKKANITSNSYQILSSEAIGSGMHTWYVETTNGCITQSNETWSFRVDVTQPTVFSLVSPSDNSWTTNSQPTFTWDASTDANSGLAKYQLWIDGSLNTDNISVSSSSVTPTTTLTNGSHTWEIRAVDNVGNVRSSTQIWTVKIDNLPPSSLGQNCLSFDGINDEVNVNNRSIFSFTNVMSIESWIFINSYVDGANIIDKGSAFELRQYNGRLNFALNNDDVVLGSYSNKTIPLNTWTHVAVTYQSGTVKYYINGRLDRTDYISSQSITNNQSQITIGRNTDPRNIWWDGKISNVRIWNIIRSESDISNNKDRSLICESGLVGDWNLNEGTGNTAFDKSIYQNNGIISGATYQNSPVCLALCDLKTPTVNQNLSSKKPTFSWGKTTDEGIGFQKFQLFIDCNMVKDNLSDSTWTVTSPLAYGEHTWYVKGFDLLGNNQPSYSRTFYVDNASPNVFNLTSPANNQIVNLPTPNLTWQATVDSIGGSGLRKYQLYINGVVNRDSIPITQTTVAPKNALSQGIYTWYINAFDNVDNVRKSTQTNTFYVDWEEPTAFTLISPLDNSTLTVAKPEFKWHKSTDVGSGISKYELNITGQTAINVTPTDTSFVLAYDLDNGQYTWFVKAYDIAGSFTSSNTQSFNVDATISELKETALNNQIKVYPNPVENDLHIEYSNKNERINFVIINSLGQFVFKGVLLGETTINTNNLSTGIYLLKFNFGKNYEYKKFLKK